MVNVKLKNEQVSTIKAMIVYMLTEEDLNKVDDNFVDKLRDLESTFDKVK
jgi:hypothetical protein